MKKLRDNGVVLGTVLVSMVLITLTGMLYLKITGDRRIAVYKKDLNSKAFWIAEAGLEKTISILKKDLKNDSTDPSWNDGIFDTYDLSLVSPNNIAYYDFLNNIPFGYGNFKVKLMNVSDGMGGSVKNEILVQSEGTMGSEKITVQSRLKAIDLAPWNNAVFGGNGFGSGSINGNVIIAGSLFILGKDLLPTDIALSMGGGAGISNNYTGMDPALEARTWPLPTVLYEGEVVKTLNSMVYVKQGIVILSGSASLGAPQTSLNLVKEPLDAVYVADGITISGAGSVNADTISNTVPEFELPDNILVADPNYVTNFESSAVVINSSITLGSIDRNYTDGTNSLSYFSTGTLTINGNIYIKGSLTIDGGTPVIIEYTGKGTILTDCDVTINKGLVTAGNLSFPSNVVLIISRQDMNIDLGGPSLGIMGAFCARNKITVVHQTEIIGSISADYFDFFQVPAVYHVPELSNNMPTGAMQSEPIWHISTGEWQKISN